MEIMSDYKNNGKIRISELSSISSISEDDLLVVSKKTDDIKYNSSKITFGDMKSVILSEIGSIKPLSGKIYDDSCKIGDIFKDILSSLGGNVDLLI